MKIEQKFLRLLNGLNFSNLILEKLEAVHGKLTTRCTFLDVESWRADRIVQNLAIAMNLAE
jgi:hypothetical protein